MMVVVKNSKDRTRRRWIGSLAVAALAVGLALGCGALDNKGSAPDNQSPEVFIVNVPPDGTVTSSSLVVNWYGTDVDGRIVRFDYTVVLKRVVDTTASFMGFNGADTVGWFIENILTDEYPHWVSVYADSTANPNHDLVKLFASTEIAACDTVVDRKTGELVPTDCVSRAAEQYFFLRGIDDRGSQSAIRYRTFNRTNHWPETFIHANFSQTDEYLSLPKRSVTYRGIQLIWGGEDPKDVFPPDVADLDFHWRVYGPYEHRPFADETLVNDTLDPNKLIIQSFNSRDTLRGVWVDDTAAFVWDLWSRADQQPTEDATITRQGWFIILVTARDDAAVADTTPAFATFTAIYPRFEREIIMIEDTWYSRGSHGNPCAARGDPRPDTNQAFQVRMMEAVYPDFDPEKDMWWRYLGVEPGKPCTRLRAPYWSNCANRLPLQILAQHKLVIYIDDDINKPLPGTFEVPPVQVILRRYLDVGGKLWVMSRSGLIKGTEACLACICRRIDFTSDRSSQRNDFAVEYFDIEEMYYGCWRRTVVPIKQSGVEPTLPNTNDEFIGATLLSGIGDLPPVLEVDPDRVARACIAQDYLDILEEALGFVPDIPGVLDVNVLVKGTRSTPLYTYESWRPKGPIPPENGPSFVHGGVVMQRMVGPDRDTPLYKTAYTTFPLYFLKEEQARELYIGMVDWFMLDYALTP